MPANLPSAPAARRAPCLRQKVQTTHPSKGLWRKRDRRAKILRLEHSMLPRHGHQRLFSLRPWALPIAAQAHHATVRGGRAP